MPLAPLKTGTLQAFHVRASDLGTIQDQEIIERSRLHRRVFCLQNGWSQPKFLNKSAETSIFLGFSQKM
jgi:hypothetical protein